VKISHLSPYIPVLILGSTSVGYLNGEGELVSSEVYGEVNDIPEKVKVLNDTLFAVIGTKFIGYQNSTAGNPYASIFVLVDTVQNFLVSGINGESIDDVFQIKVYPNPSDGTVNVSFTDDYESKPHLVEIHNLAGTKLGSYSLDLTETLITLNLNYIPSGTYIGTLHFEDGRTKSFKFSIH
jgi:Secretion system C-terminal sorting domain